jgi:phosphoribosylformimino-5-aminoimidazole carboxamide ribotide isomerase
VQLYPALDIRAGRPARAGADADPRDLLRQWHAAGTAWVHLADLDRAFGTGDNTPLIRSLCGTSGPRIQLGGGLVGDDVRGALGWGARRVVVGAHGAAGLGDLVTAHGSERIAIALDLRHGVVERPAGGTVGTPETLLDAAVAAGVRTAVVRDLTRDGSLAGAGLEAARRLARPGVDLIVAGGVASLDDLRAARDAGLAGVIVGRALLAGRFTLEEALACCG